MFGSWPDNIFVGNQFYKIAVHVRAEAATALTPNATNGEKIKALRTAQGMSMTELSRRASMSDRAIRYIEAGEREPSVDAIQKIAAALGVTTDYFMDDATFQKELSDDQFYADVRKKYGSRGVAQANKRTDLCPFCRRRAVRRRSG